MPRRRQSSSEFRRASRQLRSGQPAVWRIDTYRDTREAQVIEELSGSETVQCIAEEIVGPLRAHDAASGMDLLDTPVTVIKCNCNISLTARTLYIHRTSLPIGWKRVNRSQECRSKIRRICSYWVSARGCT